MGMTYAELSIYGRLRKISRCGPVAMFRQCLASWAGAAAAGAGALAPAVVAQKVKDFFRWVVGVGGGCRGGGDMKRWEAFWAGSEAAALVVRWRLGTGG